MYRIFIIEDDEIQCRELRAVLENSLYQALTPNLEGREGKGLSAYLLEEIRKERPDLILLDIELPGLDGIALCRKLRETSRVPVIFLTGRTGAMDELNGILSGGDDYITKPYCAPVMLARIAAVLKRTAGAGEEERMRLSCGEYTLCILDGTITRAGRSAELTRTELRIMHLLFLHAGEIVGRDELLDYLWENQIFIDDNTLSVNITRIRGKLKEIGGEAFIRTRRGQGYQI